MIRRIYIITSFLLLAILPACKRQNPVSRALDEFDSKWTVASTVEAGVAKDGELGSGEIVDDSRISIQGYVVHLNNLLSDSRGTVMAYSEWHRLLLSKNLSEEDRLNRISMLGGTGTIYPFQCEGGSHGFLVFNTQSPASTWAEVWDAAGVRRIRADFEGQLPPSSEASTLAEKLAGLAWPANQAEQAAP